MDLYYHIKGNCVWVCCYSSCVFLNYRKQAAVTREKWRIYSYYKFYFIVIKQHQSPHRRARWFMYDFRALLIEWESGVLQRIIWSFNKYILSNVTIKMLVLNHFHSVCIQGHFLNDFSSSVVKYALPFLILHTTRFFCYI